MPAGGADRGQLSLFQQSSQGPDIGHRVERSVAGGLAVGRVMPPAGVPPGQPRPSSVTVLPRPTAPAHSCQVTLTVNSAHGPQTGHAGDTVTW